MTYRNRKLLDLAHRITECQIKLPGVCIQYSMEGCVPAHSDQQIHGKGIGIKSNDVYFAASCTACNTALCDSKKFDREQKRHYWQVGFEKTLLILWERKWITVSK